MDLEPTTLERMTEALAIVPGDRVLEIGAGAAMLGWRGHGPFQAILVAAGAPDLPGLLLDQLAIGGRLVIAVGPPAARRLVRVTRKAESEFVREDLGLADRC